jgi:hypothetical protein
MKALLTVAGIGLLLTFGIASPKAQAPYEGGEFMGFAVDTRLTKDWAFSPPSDRPFTLMSALIQTKTPAWFPVSSQELPLAFAFLSGGGLRQSRGEYELAFARKKPQLAVVYLRASWIKAPSAERAELLRILGETMQQEFKTQVPKLLDYNVSTDQSLGSDCVRIDARFLQNPSHPQEVVTTRRFLCPHPDMPAYIVEMGYGERSGPQSDLKALETQLQPLRTSFRLRPLEGHLKELPGSHVTAIPVGCFVGAITATPDAIWVSVGHRLLIRIDPQTGHVVDSIDVRKSVTGIVPFKNDLWLSFDHSTDATTKNGDVLLRLDLQTKEAVELRVKAAEALGFKGAHELAFGNPSVVATLDGVNWEIEGSDGTLLRTDPVSSKPVGDPLHISGAGYSGAENIVAGYGALWLSSGAAGVVYRIELQHTAVR